MSSLHGFQLALLPYTRVIQANHKVTYTCMQVLMEIQIQIKISYWCNIYASKLLLWTGFQCFQGHCSSYQLHVIAAKATWLNPDHKIYVCMHSAWKLNSNVRTPSKIMVVSLWHQSQVTLLYWQYFCAWSLSWQTGSSSWHPSLEHCSRT